MAPTVPTLGGKAVTLRAPQPEDKVRWLAIPRDADFVRLNGGDATVLAAKTEAAAERWVASYSESLRWLIEAESELVGEIRLDGLNEADRRASMAIGIYPLESRNRGYGTEASSLVLDYAFGSLGLHRVELRVLSFNDRAIHVYRKLGFVYEGIERDSANIGGVWASDLRMSILESEWRR